MVEKYLAEFIGTFMLVFAVGCNVLSGQAMWGVTSIACTLAVSIYALSDVSGAHFNPAVSLSLGLCRKMPWIEVGKYVGVQLLAGVLAGIAYGALFGEVFSIGPTAGHGFFQAALAEFYYTFMLCFVVLNVTASKALAGNQFYGIAIGFVIIAGGYGAGHISGGCFNPAVALGIDVSSAMLGFGWSIAYVVFECAGAAAAAGFFLLCRPEEIWESEPDEYRILSKLACEFVGTFALVLTVGLNVLSGSPAPVWSIGASLTSMVFALGDCSGAHFNPAVTAAVLFSGRDIIRARDAALYVAMQLSAGLMASFTYAFMAGDTTFPYATFPLRPGEAHGWMQALFLEAAFTFLLAFVVLNVATTREPLSEYFGLAIGSCVVAGGCAIGSVSGGSLNPAVSFGIGGSHAFSGGSIFGWLFYSLFEIAGGVLAAAVFRGVRPSEYEVYYGGAAAMECGLPAAAGTPEKARTAS